MTRDMKDSGIEWIGFVPTHWEIRKVKQYYNLQTGFTPDTKKEEYYDDANGYDWVNISDIQDGKIITETKKKISKTYVDLFSPAQIPAGSLMYSFKLSIGQTAFAGKPLYSNEAIASFLPSETIDLRFLRYSSFMIMENAEVNIYNARILNRDRINNAYIVFPPLDEQHLIADYLDTECTRIDAVIEQTRTSIEEYKRLKQAVITQAVTKGIRPNRSMRDSGIEWIGEINSDYSLLKIKYFISDYKAGPFGSSLITSNLLDEGNILVYTPEHVTKQSDCIPNNLFLPENRRQEMQQFFVEEGHIVFPIVGSLGKAMYITPDMREGIINQRLAKFRINEKVVDKDFFMYVFAKGNFYKQFFEVNSRGAIIANLTKEIVYNMLFPLPSLSEQKEIVSYLDIKTREIDLLIEKKEQYVSALESLKQAIIYEYVTGKKEVTA